MSALHSELALHTTRRESATDITDRVRDEVIRRSPAHVNAILCFFADFDGPRERVATVTVSGERPD